MTRTHDPALSGDAAASADPAPPDEGQAPADRAPAEGASEPLTFSKLVRGFRSLGPAGPLAIIAGTLPAISGIVLLGTLNIVGPWLSEQGATGILLYVVGFMVLSGFALLPTYAQAVLGGWAFGFTIGLPAALCGFLGGSLIGYVIANRTASSRITELIDERPKWLAVRDALIGGGPLKTLGIVTLVRLPPNSPFALTNLVLGSTRVSMPPYAVGTLVGMAPRTAVAVFLAAGLAEFSLEETRRSWMFIAGAVTTIAVVIVIGSIANRALARATGLDSYKPASDSPDETPEAR